MFVEKLRSEHLCVPGTVLGVGLFRRKTRHRPPELAGCHLLLGKGKGWWAGRDRASKKRSELQDLGEGTDYGTKESRAGQRGGTRNAVLRAAPPANGRLRVGEGLPQAHTCLVGSGSRAS